MSCGENPLKYSNRGQQTKNIQTAYNICFMMITNLIILYVPEGHSAWLPSESKQHLEQSLWKWANSTLGEFKMFVKKSVSTGQIELAFYFKPFAPLPSAGTKDLPLPWRISTLLLDIWPCREDIRPRSLFFWVGLIQRKPVRLLRWLASLWPVCSDWQPQHIQKLQNFSYRL